jgi:hypothetical protein
MTMARWLVVVGFTVGASHALVGCGNGEDVAPSVPPVVSATTASTAPVATPSAMSSTRTGQAPSSPPSEACVPARPRVVPVTRPPGGSIPVPTASTTRSPSPPIPQDREYRTVADVIEDSDDGPWIAFDMMQSYPPQLAFGIPLDAWDWSQVDGEQSAGDVTWTSHAVELVGTWNGAGFVLTRPPRPASAPEKQPERQRGTPIEGSDPDRWRTLLDGLFRANVGVYSAALDERAGGCSVHVDALVDSPELREVLEPLGDAAYVTYVLHPLDEL